MSVRLQRVAMKVGDGHGIREELDRGIRDESVSFLAVINRVLG